MGPNWPESSAADGWAGPGGFEVEMSEPYSIFTGLPLPELESLRADITSYVQARHAKPIRFGNAVGPVQPKAHSSTRRESLRREYVGMAECRRMHSGRTAGSPAAALLWTRTKGLAHSASGPMRKAHADRSESGRDKHIGGGAWAACCMLYLVCHS